MQVARACSSCSLVFGVRPAVGIAPAVSSIKAATIEPKRKSRRGRMVGEQLPPGNTVENPVLGPQPRPHPREILNFDRVVKNRGQGFCLSVEVSQGQISSQSSADSIRF